MGNPVVGTHHWERVKEILDSALELPLDEREAFLEEATATDPTLKSEVARVIRGIERDTQTLFQRPPQGSFSLAPGDLISDRYHIVRIIGRGGMGEVYEALDRMLHEHIALKTLRSDLSNNEISLWRFRREIQLARKVTHPNVCRVFEVGAHELEDAGRPPLQFFTMELLKGETLAARIRRLKRLPKQQAIPIAIQMAEGLQAAHAVNVIHMDFKSGNVMLIEGRESVRAVITDFGLATAVAVLSPTADTVTMQQPTGRVAGTVAYMSPEQLTGRAITQASDIYSFGIVLYEMATGQLPFDVQNVVNSAVQRASGEIVTARLLVPDLDLRWDAAISRCLQKDPRDRFPSAGDIADWLRGGGLRMPRLLWTRRDWIRASAAGGAAVAVGGTAWMLAHRPYQPKPESLNWYEKGVAALHSMTFEAARKALEQAVAADPKFALAHATLARAYEELDYSDLAKDSMLRALTLAESTRLSSTDQKRLRAFEYLVSREYDRAAPLFAELEKEADEMEKPAAALETGWVAQQREDTEAAAAAYERALKPDPRYAAAKLRLGYIQGRRRQVDAALQTFTEAETLYSASSDYEGVTETLLQKASLLNRSSRSAEALPIIEKALAVAATLNSASQQIRLELVEGVAVRNLGNAERAGAIAEHAVEAARAEKMDNVATGGLIDLGSAFLARGDWAPAEQYYRSALDFARRNKGRRNEARAQLSLGSLFEQENRPDSAQPFLDAAFGFYRQAGYRRELVQTSALLGSVHAQRAEFDEGTRILQAALPQAIELRDPQAEGLLRERLGDCLRDQGAWPDALIEYGHALDLLGSGNASLSGRLNRAHLYWQLGQREEAEETVAELEQRLSANPDFQLLKAEIAYSDGRVDAAEAIAKGVRADSGDALHSTQASLIEALAQIRLGRGRHSLGTAAAVIEQFDRKGFKLQAASARLAAAEAVLYAGGHGAAPLLPSEALSFFEPRQVWEAVWRAHAVIAQSSDPVAAQAHREASRAALNQLRSAWPHALVDVYLTRADIAPLYKGLGVW